MTRSIAVRTCGVAVVATTVLGVALASGASANASPSPAAAVTAAAPQIVPKPVSLTTGRGAFALTDKSEIVASGAAQAVANDLRADLTPATGYRLPVRGGSVRTGDIQLLLGNPGTLAGHPDGYQLSVGTDHVTLVAPRPSGLFDGVQTIRQLLPGWIASHTRQAGPWTMPAVSITDYPRYQYRGVMFDIARHYEPPSAVEKIIDEASSYKMNELHLHLSDDQGFRVVINGFPRLTAIGGQGSVGTHGRTMDPGGFWTQAQYVQVVKYAKAHFMTLIPEVDSPSHNNAIEMSEYNDTKNPLLNGHPQDIACGYDVPPKWNYSEDVGYSGMCPNSSNTWAIYTAIIDQLSKLSDSPYYDLGGDEAHPFTNAEYAEFVNHETTIVQAAHEIPMGWADGYATTPGSNPPKGSIAESWEPGATDGAAAVKHGMKVVMAPADHAYLDQSYPNDTSGLGLSWACKGCDLDVNYDWDPGSFPGVPDSSVLGVEGALFGETIPTLKDAEWLLLPRMMAIAELGWSPKAARTGVTSAAFVDFAKRVAAQGPRLQAAGLNFYPTTEVPWGLAGHADDATTGSSGQVIGTLALVSAPGLAPSAVHATVYWNDGSAPTKATVSGTAPKPGRVNGLYRLTATHRYRSHGHHTATVTLRASGRRSVTFTVPV